MLIAEEAGRLRVVKDGSPLPAAALDISAKVCSDAERGVMAVVADPAFAVNRQIYLYYTWKKHGSCPYSDPLSPVNRVSRFVLGDNNTVDPRQRTGPDRQHPGPRGLSHRCRPAFRKGRLPLRQHRRRRLRLRADRQLEDLNDASRDQHVLLGKVLRVTAAGGIPPTNPFLGAGTARCNTTGRTDPGKRCQETYAWGLRNPFRMAFDPNSTGTRFFVNDVGEITWEEIDLGQAGVDYGWNVREGFCVVGSTSNCGAPPAGMTNPIHAYNHDTGCTSITGGAFVPNGAWSPAYDGSYLFGDVACGRMFKLDPAGGGGWTQTDFASGFGDYSIVTMTFGPPATNQYLYYATLNAPGHQIRRIAYRGPGPYPRPGGATPLRVPLVPAFAACTSPNTSHVGPLSSGSCAPPARQSALLTTSTTGLGAGSAQLAVLPGNVGTDADEADVELRASATDVRRASDGGDYTGQLLLRTLLRVTDRANGAAGTVSATVQDLRFDVPFGCLATAGTAGGSCTLSTTADTLVPGFAREGKRTVIASQGLEVMDAGPDGIVTPASGAPRPAARATSTSIWSRVCSRPSRAGLEAGFAVNPASPRRLRWRPHRSARRGAGLAQCVPDLEVGEGSHRHDRLGVRVERPEGLRDQGIDRRVDLVECLVDDRHVGPVVATALEALGLALVDVEERLDQAAQPLPLGRGAREDLARTVRGRQPQAREHMLPAALDQIVDGGEVALYRLHRDARLRGDLLKARLADSLRLVERQREVDDSLTRGVDAAAPLGRLVAGRALEPLADRRHPEVGADAAGPCLGAVALRNARHGGRSRPQDALRPWGELPEDVPADLGAADEAGFQQAASGAADLGLVDLEQLAQLAATQSWRALERADEAPRMRSLRDLVQRRLRTQALEPPV